MSTGQVVTERFHSRLLEGNRAGDPADRRVPIYLPPSYAGEKQRRYPVCYMLTGFTGRGRMLLNDNPWNPALDDRMDGLILRGESEEMILVMPDCFTRYGGSQYLNSSATGRYMDHLIEELVPFVDARYRTLPDRGHRGVSGKSSGGYGAMVLGMMHPATFGAVACHSGDMCFDYCYRGDVPKALTEIQRAGGLAKWMEAFEAKRQKKNDDMLTLNILGMSAAYSPNPASRPFGFDLPCDLESGVFREEVWARWLEYDPIRMLESRADALRSMKLLYMDCGTRDEWSLHHGARLFTRRLAQLGIAHEYEEFDDGHMNVQYRYEVSLPRLARALAAA